MGGRGRGGVKEWRREERWLGKRMEEEEERKGGWEEGEGGWEEGRSGGG